MITVDEKYKSALQLYRNTDKTITQISRECGVTRTGFACYIQKYHRDLMYARHGIATSSPDRAMKSQKGQSPQTRKKYRKAIEACDSEKYIHLNVAQIAVKFHLSATGLSNQLRAHYPDIIARREKERQRRGIADNMKRGARKSTVEAYSEAVELLKSTDMTIEEVADACNISFSGFRQHVQMYHKDLVDLRRNKRQEGQLKPKIGKVSGNGRVRKAEAVQSERFAEALDLYRNSSLPIKEICRITDTSVQAFRNYLHKWHKELVFRRRGAFPPDDSSDRELLNGVKRSNPWTAEKYAPAIAELESGSVNVESTARKYGFVPVVFREYLKEHHYQLWQKMGMTELPNGRKVLSRSYEKYADAIKAYETTGESLKSIASRMGIPYNSIGGFIRRNMPEVIERHNSQPEVRTAR